MTTFATGDQLTAAWMNAIPRTNFLQEDLAAYRVLLSAFRYADGSIPDTTGAAGNPKIIMGGYGSGTGKFEGEDAHGATKTETLCFDAILPPEYVAGETVTLTVTCRYSDSGTGSMSTKTIDAEAYEIAEAGTAGSDICATAAQNITTSMAQYSFTITPTNLTAGDTLRVFLRIVLTESGGSGAQRAEFGGATIKADIKG